MKTYVEHMNAISSDGFYIGLLGYRMFAEKLPPVFTSESFLNYCLDKQPAFENKACLVMPWLYYQKYTDKAKSDKLKQEAILLRDTDMDRYWFLVYEALEKAVLDKEWKAIKKEKVSFVMLPCKEEVSL